MPHKKLTKSVLQKVFPKEDLEEDVFIIDTIINDISFQEEYFHELYQNPDIQKIAGFIETHTARKERLLSKYFKPFNYLYYSADFILTRVSPKLKWTEGLYHFLSRGKGHVLSKTEILGKLYYSGFEVIHENIYEHKWYFIVGKKPDHERVDYVPKKGLIITLPRIGKNGKLINVYKCRTMHPYAEFIQEYVYLNNDLQEGGKLKDDFRISTIGKFLRKYWIDELPMIGNVLKGEMKLIGVRPLSKHYMSLYEEDLQELRKSTKPGLLPPFYADMPKTLKEIQDSERNYLTQYLKNPIRTDLKYLYKIFYNILIKRKRSA